ncbi:MAG: response regulator [Phycisphaerales bacterium]|nr:response regulator [Phycisphaerales bacterium]
MTPADTSPAVAARTAELFRQDCQRVWRNADRLFVGLLLIQWPMTVAAALTISPRTWIGAESAVHRHVWAAIVIGGLLTLFPAWLARKQPGAAVTRHVLAAAQVGYSALLIHVFGGRIETHFHVFGSLAFIAFYRDWKVLLTASAIVAADHLLRGMWWPRSVFGMLSPGRWRWMEHALWVTFEDTVLLLSIARAGREAHLLAQRQAELEASKSEVEEQVRVRTAELEAARAAAESASGAKTEFLANMSHEIRTPMTAIVGYAELLDEPALSPAERAEHVRTIRRNGEHLIGVINDILDLSKIEAGRLDIASEQCRVCQVVSDVAALMRVRAKGKNVDLKVEYEFPVPESIRTDPLRLRQILVNLVGNAVKFTERGGVRIVVRTLADDPSRSRIEIAVHDSGIGICPQDLEVLFRPFTQVDNSRTRRFGGAGLGLAISRRLAHMLGGEIVVESAPGSGSVFTLRLPVGDLAGARMIHDPSEALTPVDDQAGAALPTLRGRILLAEDGPDNQRLIAFHLRRAGADVALANNGREALDLAIQAKREGRPFGLVFMDMQMPVMDGYEATRSLRAAGYELPIVALTAHAMADERQRCIEAGCDDYETKPISPFRLLNAAARFLEAARAAA